MTFLRAGTAFIMAAFVLSVALSHEALAINTVRVASGLSLPVFTTTPPGDTARLFIVEQRSGSTGRIRILRNGTVLPRPFLSVPNLATGSEQGLLGLAFHPNYAANGYLFVDYTRGSDGATIIARYHVSSDADSVEAASTQTILMIPQPYSNHNGGMIAFGQDGYLYIGMGDGGNGNDPGGRAQSDTTLLGKMLRIDVDSAFPYAIPPSNPNAGSATARQEIWAKGLRNPWRWSFDRQTHDLIIADVGQNAWEEIDFQPAASAGGQNYGWRCMEGYNCTGLSGCTCNDPALTLPVYNYNHSGGKCSITGGYIYRGCAIPSLRGTYFFADFCSNQIWTGTILNDTLRSVQDRTAELNRGGQGIAGISSFGEDALGEMYICDLNGGEIFKLIPDTLTDCNHNNRSDACDIALGSSPDHNLNGIPDECECAPQIVTNLVVAFADTTFELQWSAVGNGTETYTVYRSVTAEAAFPGPAWNIVASGLPHPNDNSPITCMDAAGFIASDRNFYLVTSVCP
jgi:glucose/arabinose dehydrogenase